MTDPILLLRKEDPAGAPSEAESARMDAAFALLPAGGAGAPEARGERAPRPRGAGSRGEDVHRPRRTRRLAALGFAAACAVAVAVAAAPDRAPRTFAPAPATAATVLAQLGHKAAAVHAQSGRYAYAKSLAYVSHMRPKPGGKGTFVVVIPTENETRVAADGTAIQSGAEHLDQAMFPTPEDKADFDKAPKMAPLDLRPRLVKGLKVGGLTAEQVLALPTDPGRLHDAIADNGMAITAAAAQLLDWPLTPQPVKAALYTVLKDLPSATLAGDQTDPLGRTGVGIRFDDDNWRTLFLFDEQTGALIGTRSIGKHEVPGREISDWSLTVDQGRRDDAPKPTAPTMDWTAR
jgi:hypothetical protein